MMHALKKMCFFLISFIAMICMSCSWSHTYRKAYERDVQIEQEKEFTQINGAARAIKKETGKKNVKKIVKSLPEYKLGIGDIIEVKFFYHHEFNETITVRPDGRITLQRIGSIYVLGTPPSVLQAKIRKQYAEIIKEPEVTVFLREYAELKIYVMGEVEHPGGFAWRHNSTLFGAIAEAGGFKRSAKQNNILHLRMAKDKLVGRKLDFNNLLNGKLRMSELKLRPNDVIFVPSSTISNIREFVAQFYDIILPPIDLYYQASLLTNLGGGIK